ncbi:MAG: O-acetyl-ADP-ribose deacetylase [Acidimicrobiales bacterium]
MHLEAVLGDITQQEVNAIVNAANELLAGGGGVDGAVHRAAGAREMHEACQRLGGCSTGDAKVTPGFALKARWVIHTVGPRWKGGGHGEEQALRSCYRRCLEVADELGVSTIAFPAISTGAYGYPPERAATVAVETLLATPTKVSLARLVAFDERTLALYMDLLSGRGAGL